MLDEISTEPWELEPNPKDDPDLKVSEDVSFPVEIQQRAVIADELRKLGRLFEDGVINEQEFDAAKTKLLQ